jgi:hypothetical protein
MRPGGYAKVRVFVDVQQDIVGVWEQCGDADCSSALIHLAIGKVNDPRCGYVEPSASTSSIRKVF